ncbi:MAG TPA: hypothetical protein VFP61_03110 [Acidimicrobiales bacterium]|nr:hypothetical protein [Acidimicrobiales bacterium]
MARFAGAVAGAAERVGRPAVLGSPDDEPWHFVAHLADEARRSGAASVAPVWVRWQAPSGAPPHLATTVADLPGLARSAPLLVMAADSDPRLLERVHDARRAGALVLAVDGAGGDLAALAHEQLVVPTAGRHPRTAGSNPLDAPGHLLSVLLPRAAQG